MSSTGELWIAGVHEAGHCLAAAALGIPLWKGSVVSLLPDEQRPESNARTVFDFDGKTPEQIIRLSFAGPIAEARVFSTTGSTTDALAIAEQMLRIYPNDLPTLAAAHATWSDVGSDEWAMRFVRQVAALAVRPPLPGEVSEEVAYSPTFIFLSKLAQETRSLLEENWRLIESFAGLLLERKTIPAGEAAEFFTEVFDARR